MNEKIKELYQQAVMYGFDNRFKETPEIAEKPLQEVFIEKFAELIMSEAFRAGMLYSAKKYANVSKEQFTGNDVAMFLEMEADELSDEDINQHFGIKE